MEGPKQQLQRHLDRFVSVKGSSQLVSTRILLRDWSDMIWKRKESANENCACCAVCSVLWSAGIVQKHDQWVCTACTTSCCCRGWLFLAIGCGASFINRLRPGLDTLRRRWYVSHSSSISSGVVTRWKLRLEDETIALTWFYAIQLHWRHIVKSDINPSLVLQSALKLHGEVFE